MEPIVSSETSTIRTQTPGNYPKRNNLQENVDFVINIAGSQSFGSRGCDSKYCSTVRRDNFVVAQRMLIVLSPLFVQLMHANYYKIVKQLKSFKIITVAPTCFGLHKPSSGSSQPVLR